MKFVPLPFKGVGEVGLVLPPPPFCEFLGAFCYCLLQGGGGSRRRRRLIQSSTQRSCLSSDLEAFVDSLRPSVFQFQHRFNSFASLLFYIRRWEAVQLHFQILARNPKDYIFDQRFTLTMLSATGTEWVATGLKKDDFFFGDISTLFKGQNTIVDLKIDGHSSVSTKVTIKNLMPSAKVVISFKIPYHKSGKLDVQYVHPHATLHYRSQTICLGGEVGFDTASSLLTKYNAGIGFNKPDFFAALMLATYVHKVNPTTSVGAELIRHFSSHDNSFTIGSSYSLDPFTTVKARLSNNGKAGMVVQSEWRPKSLVTLSDEYDSKAVTCSPELGLVLALKP
ncbi:BnaC09g32780D [Brassica napus]|uniref:BnaC09g32780D protein n=1 Tax=Brassica napus TaxID=3708 RepID=A0A078GKI3_BRANA|nr:BnaC09g32780D [Brassica napus]